jgi:hypothetical protein
MDPISIIDPITGRPYAIVTHGAEELIPTVQFGNVKIGPGSVTRFVSDDPESIATGLRECVQAVEKIIAEERELVLKMVRGG